MLKKHLKHLVDTREIGASDRGVEYGHEAVSSGLGELIGHRTSSPAIRRHGRRHSDATRFPVSESAPRLERSSGAPVESPDDSSNDPFRKERRNRATVTPARGSFRGKKFASPEEQADSMASGVAQQSRKKGVIKKLLGRTRTSTRERLELPEVESDDNDVTSEGSFIVHDDVSSRPVTPPSLSPRSRLRAGGMIVPKDTEDRVESALRNILEMYEVADVPLQELEAMRLECEQCQQEAEQMQEQLQEAVHGAVATSKLSEYEYVAEELLDDALGPKFSFGFDDLVRLDERLVRMERRASRSIRSSSMSQTVLYALLALMLGVFIAWKI